MRPVKLSKKNQKKHFRKTNKMGRGGGLSNSKTAKTNFASFLCVHRVESRNMENKREKTTRPARSYDLYMLCRR